MIVARLRNRPSPARRLPGLIRWSNDAAFEFLAISAISTLSTIVAMPIRWGSAFVDGRHRALRRPSCGIRS
jgi:hypothetical protein